MESEERILGENSHSGEHLPEVIPLSGTSSEDKQDVIPTWDERTENRVKRKFDLHILPWIFLLWLLAFIDRSNLGNAQIVGIDESLDLVGTRFNTAVVVFHALYIAIDLPSSLLVKKIGGGIFLPATAVAWGLILTCMGSVESYGGLLACRIFLGGAEGAFYAAVVLYLSMFYKRNELSFRVGILASSGSLSGAFGGLLATGLGQIDYGGYYGWPWIFFIEGAMTILLAIVSFFFLPNTPSSARFLTQPEHMVAVHRLYLESKSGTGSERVEEERFSLKTARFAILNVNTLLMSWNYLLILIPTYSFSIFLPAILEGMKYEGTTAQLLTVPPNMLAFFFTIASTFFSDYIKMRGPLIIAGLLFSSIGYIIQLASSDPSVQYAGVFFIGAGIFPCSPLILTWLSNNLAPHYPRATGLGFITGTGQIGAIIATFTYLQSQFPAYTTGHSISLGAIGLAVIGVSANIIYIKWENAARKAGKRDSRLKTAGEGRELGYRHPDFRYMI